MIATQLATAGDKSLDPPCGTVLDGAAAGL